MTIRRTDQDLPARRRVELTHAGKSRLLHAIDAQRRLNAARADLARTRADPHDPADPRHAYLTWPHD